MARPRGSRPRGPRPRATGPGLPWQQAAGPGSTSPSPLGSPWQAPAEAELSHDPDAEWSSTPRRSVPESWDADWWAAPAQAPDHGGRRGGGNRPASWNGIEGPAAGVVHDAEPVGDWFDEGVGGFVDADGGASADDPSGEDLDDDIADAWTGPRDTASDTGPRQRAQRGGGAHARRPADADAGLLPFARRHLAVVVVALVVALCLAASYLFRARTAAVPLSVVAGTPSAGATASYHASGQTSSGAGAEASGVIASGVRPTAVRTSGGATPDAASSTPTSVTVQVLGAVRHPGLVALPSGSRVQDAIRAAGGLAPGADPGELNLAIVLQDADQVVVGTSAHPGGAVRPATAAAGGSPTGGATSTGARSGATDSASLVVDLNTATLAQLDALPGVGPTTAQRIIDWRTQHGRFTSAQELQEVEGIGPKSYAKLAPHVRV